MRASLDSQRELILGLDVGQTSTKSLLALSNGQILGRGVGGPADHFHVAGGIARNRAAIHDAVRTAYEIAGLTPGPLAAVALGVTGVHRDSPEIALVENIVREILQPRAIAVHPDYVTNLAGASRGGWGVAVVAGGGSIAYGTSQDGRKEGIAGGFGYLLGDEGSAYDIGRRAVAAAAQADDGRGEPTILEPVVREAFAVTTMREIPRIVYDAGFSRDRLSRLAPLVVRAADSGDVVAQQIVRRSARELARTALSVVRQVAAPGELVPIYVTGGVFTAGDTVLTPFEEHVWEAWPSADIRQPAFPPLVGALIEARRASAGDIDDAWFERVRDSLSE